MGSISETVGNAMGVFAHGVHEYADFDARGLGMSALDPDTGANMRFIEVPTPAWIPDSFLRSLKRNLYFNMVNNASYYGTARDKANGGTSLSFYKESSGGLLSNLLNTAVKSVVNVAANQVMSISSKVESVVDGVSSLFGSSGGSKDLLSMVNETSRNPFLAAQPYLNIYGIHLAEEAREIWDTIHFTAIGAARVFNGLNEEPFDKVAKDFEKNLMASMNSLGILPKGFDGLASSGVDGAFKKALQGLLSQPDSRMHNFAEAQMLAGISGYYTMRCKLPFFGDESPMMQSSGTNAFSTGYGITPQKGDSGENGLLSLVSNSTHVSWSNHIKWSPERVDSDAMTPVSYAFHIYNDTLEHVLTNLVFIWTFGATTQAVTDLFTIRPPYLYDIEVPGGVRFKYCVCGFVVKPMGKLRRITSAAGDKGSMISKLFKQTFGFDVNPDAISHVPDYYKVSIKFTPLLPNLWNFIDSYLHDAASKPRTGNELRHMLSKAVRNFADFGDSK